MNYMECVATSFGLVLNEKFIYIDIKSNEISNNIYCFKKDGVFRHIGNENYVRDNDVLINILKGIYEIIKLPWSPHNGDIVYAISPINNIEEFIYNNNHPVHVTLNDCNLIFRNKRFAEEYLNKYIKENN